MVNIIYNQIQKEYDLKRQRAIDIANSKKQQLYKDHPTLEELEHRKNLLAVKFTKKMLLADNISRQIEEENIKIELEKIDYKIIKELKKLNLTLSDFEPEFECNICNDTGKVDKNGIVRECTCFSQRLINETYKQSNMLKLSDENFLSFEYAYYSSKANKAKYGIEKSPRENIERIVELSKIFANNIDNPEQKNLMFTGNTGLGKTFLANSIANEVLKQGKSVVYQTAPILMDKIIEYKYSPDKTGKLKDQYNKIFDVDLLIIDDLGTETMSNNKFTELFNIINTRLLKNKKILISTNLTLNELYNTYDERVVSRLIGNFTICKLVGEDIRLKKKRIN